MERIKEAFLSVMRLFIQPDTVFFTILVCCMFIPNSSGEMGDNAGAIFFIGIAVVLALHFTKTIKSFIAIYIGILILSLSLPLAGTVAGLFFFTEYYYLYNKYKPMIDDDFTIDDMHMKISREVTGYITIF